MTNGKSCVTVKLLTQNKQEDKPFVMTTVTQTMLYRQALIKYSLKYGVTKAAIRYKTNRQYIYRWRKRYDGTLQSLADKSHRPHHHPNEHTKEELKLIADMRKRNKVLCKDRYKIGLYVKMQYLSSTPLHSKKLNGKQSGNGLLNHIIGISPQPGTPPAP